MTRDRAKEEEEFMDKVMVSVIPAIVQGAMAQGIPLDDLEIDEMSERITDAAFCIASKAAHTRELYLIPDKSE